MAVQHIEIHQIAENQPALAFADGRRQFFHAVGVAFCRYVLADTAAIVNVMNLADSKNAHLPFREDVHQHRFRRVPGRKLPAAGDAENSRGPPEAERGVPGPTARPYAATTAD